MNYLAHFQLGHGDQGLLIGALLGDVVKGPLKGEYPKDWERGIQLHRKVDAFTDSHALIKQCCEQFPQPYRRYSGIMLDVAFDHFLNKHWRQHHPQSLPQFTDSIYQLLAQTQLPVAAKPKAQRIIEYDLLNNYQHWDFIIEVLAGIGKRIRYDNPLSESGHILTQQYDHIEQTFLSFYPQLQQFSQLTRQQLLEGVLK